MKFEKEVLELRAKGATYREIMQKIPISKSHVSRICNPKVREKARKYETNRYHSNPEKNKLRKRKWISKNPEWVVEYRKLWYNKNRDYCLQKLKDNRGYYNSIAAARRFVKINGFRPFATEENKLKIKNLYVLAKCLSILTKVPKEVDHIYPLKGKNSCGLHVPWNLQIIDKVLNRSKGNKIL